MQPVMKWRFAFRPIFFLALSIIMVFVMEGTLAWLGFAILSAFFVMIDIFRIGRNETNKFSMEVECALHPVGVLGEYVLDSTDSYGLFLRLIGMPIFVDIKQDELIEERKRQAIFLFENKDILEENLKCFLNENLDYRDKKIDYICLHSKKIDQCDIFWSPDGHTNLIGLHFEV